MPIVISWGEKSKWGYLENDTRAFVLTYKFISVIWILQFAWKMRYSWAEKNEYGDWKTYPLTQQQAEQANAADYVSLNWFRSKGLLIAIGLIVLSAVAFVLYAFASYTPH